MKLSDFLGIRILAFCLAMLCAQAQSEDGKSGSVRPLTVDDTVGELLDNAAARAVIEKELPILLSNPQIKQARALDLRDLQTFAPTVITDEKLELINSELVQAGAMYEQGKVSQTAPVWVDPREALTLETIPLWQGRAPGATGDSPLDIPTLTVVETDGATSFGTAVIVAPGGGYQIVATGHEGR